MRSARARYSIVDLGRKACQIYRQHSDACLTSIHCLGSRPHSTLHPLFSVFLSQLIADGLKFDAMRHELVCHATLTANLGMFEHHDRWAAQAGRLSEAQYHLRDHHTIRSVERLQAAGVNDADWLDIVLHHHEMVDGSGYPSGLAGKDIRREALILSIVDRYLAFTMPRLPRQRVHPTTALKHIYEHTGDIAIVTHRRIGDSVHPIVVSIGNVSRAIYDEPVPRNTKMREFEIKGLYTERQKRAFSP